MDESFAIAGNICRTRYGDIPSSVVEVTKKSVLDALGVTLAATALGEGCQSFVDLAIAESSGGPCTIVGMGCKVSPSMAAFANGSMAHALDFEDAHEAALVHPNAATIPAAMAIAEWLGNVSGEGFLTAVALGSDLVCRLGLALKRELLSDGWYMPPVFGAFGATAAAAKLLNLNERQILDAFSLTLCQATCSAEQVYSKRTVVRSIRDAFAAKAGVVSALLAEKGVAGFEEPFEGRGGLYQAFARGDYDPHELTRGLGELFEGGNVSFKPWPSCRGTHAYIDAALKLMATMTFHLNDIRSIEVVVSPVNRMLCEPVETKQNPLTAIDAKFSLAFCIATALVHGYVTLDQFSPDAINDPLVQTLARKVSHSVDPRLTRAQATRGSITVCLEDARLSRPVNIAYGHPSTPISSEQLIGKFKDCAGYSQKGVSTQDLDRIVEMVLNLEKVENVCELAACL